MWLALAFLSAFLLGFYDVAKKASVKDNAVLPVLFLNTLFSTLIFSPVILGFTGVEPLAGNRLAGDGIEALSMLQVHGLIISKSVIVLISWIFGYMGMKHLPLTIVGPINATRPVMVLVGAMLIFGERLNAWQWAGVILAAASLFLMSISSKKEHIDFSHNKWILCVFMAALTGACSGLYDKFLMVRLNASYVQGWYNFYQMIMMGCVCAILWLPKRKSGDASFHWKWSIPLISIFISAADFAYFQALSQPDAMISVVSLVRRSSVIVSFACGAVLFKEKNLKAKALDLCLILIGMVFIWLGSR